MKPIPIASRLLIAGALAATGAIAAPDAPDLPVLHEPAIVLKHHLQLAASDDARIQADAWRRWADDFSRDMRTSMGAMYGGRVGSLRTVKGAPYSAEVVTESNQALADGNVITRKTSGRVYRDGEGRTRQESGGDGKEPTIYITDPVEKKNYVLPPGGKKAIVSPRHFDFTHDLIHKDKRVMKFGATELRLEDGKVFLDGKEVPDGKVEITRSGKEIRVENGKVTVDGKDVSEGNRSVIVRKIDASETGDGTKREEVRIQIVRSGDGKDIVTPMPAVPPVPATPATPAVPPMHDKIPMEHFSMPVPPLPGAHTMHFESTKRLGKGTTTSLGMKDFDGVKAEGKTILWVIPAGQIGNRNPIQVSSESWYSPDLKLTVYSRHNDPRTGESIYRLASIKRGEPPADLFKPPAK